MTKLSLERNLNGGLDVRQTYPRKVGTKNQPCGESNPMWEAQWTCQDEVSDL
ncbi:MAG: hypothetical protein ABSB87_13930 [Terriglobales bacterium]|jgi:hypothetical protein